MNAGSVIIPAYNEEAVIARTLGTLLRDHQGSADFQVLVVCNGCTDRTALQVRERFPAVTVLELAQGSKTAALNAGLDRAPSGPVLLLDADVELSTRDARTLLSAAEQPDVEAAIGRMRIDATGADPIVRAFYRVWLEHPYLRHGKFAAVIALSNTGRARIGNLPPVTADDTYLRRLIPQRHVAVVDSVSFLVRVPRKAGALLKVRSRSHRGTRALDRVVVQAVQPRGSEARGLLKRVVARPDLWPAAVVYLMVTLTARLLATFADNSQWERDETSRENAGKAA
jgi:glycosyltransferase involved in cell wall biosynthesis